VRIVGVQDEDGTVTREVGVCVDEFLSSDRACALAAALMESADEIDGLTAR
jgi:hypothetical protein